MIGPALLLIILSGSDRSEPVDYGRQIKPLLKQRCVSCHGALKQQGHLRLDTGTAVRRGGDSGPAVEPGSAEESLLIDRVSESDPELRMPPEGPALTAEQVEALRVWIDQGAVSPADEAPEADPRRHWAFVPPERPALPVVRDAEWAEHPIDALLAAEYESHGLTPVPDAEPEVLLRRLHLDLVGLPPTREALAAFRTAAGRDLEAALREEVERLLASPQYGERWARHWMDVWRYSDWYGRRAVPDVLNSYAMIWRWRDWIVRSLNQDKPYSQMILEMLAADEIDPLDQENVVATGFVVRNFYRWNYNTWMKDSVEHTAKAFLGLTINCAHCHDHKYDPIKQEDYFAFRAFFEPIELRHDRVPGEPDPGPYPKYDYGKSYKPITSGLVRVFDEKLDAKTFLYTRGESRNVVEGRPPIPPGVPGFLKPETFRIERVSLPPEASYPGLQEFVRQEERARLRAGVERAEAAVAAARAALAETEQALHAVENRLQARVAIAFVEQDRAVTAFPSESGPAWDQAARAVAVARSALAACEADRVAAAAQEAALRLRIAADDARYGRSGADPEPLRRAAIQAELQARLDQATAGLTRAEHELFAGAGQPEKERARLAQQRENARKTLEAAESARLKPPEDYTPLSPTYPSETTGRRLALARWIGDRGNPLTARVAVNHVWRWHFSRPIVESTYDFGRNGKPPSHPKLLDWLAVELMESGWSLKHLHRLIVTSRAYRLASSAPGHPNLAIDPGNRGLWRFEPARMEAEVVRDSLLFVSGALDDTVGGPDIPYDQGMKQFRRSLYFTHHGEARMPFLELFDAADACDAYKRTSSVVPQQALALTNNEMLLSLSERLAAALSRTAETDEAFVIAAFEQVLSRSPTESEAALVARFLERQASLFPDRRTGRDRARKDLVLALFNHHDFVTIH